MDIIFQEIHALNAQLRVSFAHQVQYVQAVPRDIIWVVILVLAVIPHVFYVQVHQSAAHVSVAII